MTTIFPEKAVEERPTALEDFRLGSHVAARVDSIDWILWYLGLKSALDFL
jgi:hypothetical protein